MKEETKKLKDSEEIHRKELQLKIEELMREEVKKLGDSKETHKTKLYNLEFKIEKLTGEVAKKINDSEEAHRTIIHNLTLEIEKLKKDTLEEKLKEQNLLTELSNKALVTKEDALVLKLKDHERICNEEINAKFEVLGKKCKEANDIIHQKVNRLQSEIDVQVCYLKQQLQLKDTKEAYKTNDIRPELKLKT